MPATAGRVRMPANNRVHSSAALQTHGIWQSAIGYDPYAPDQKSQPDDRSGVADRAAAADQQNAYDSFQGLLALARLTGSNADVARGSCKKCGRVGHLTFQCRNYLTANCKDETAAVVAAALEKERGGKGKEADGLGELSSLDSSSEESELSSDSDEDSEMERLIASKYGKRSGRVKERSKPSVSDKRSLSSKRRESSSDDDGGEEEEEKRSKERRHKDKFRSSRSKDESRHRSRKHRSNRKEGGTDGSDDSSGSEKRSRHRHHRKESKKRDRQSGDLNGLEDVPSRKRGSRRAHESSTEGSEDEKLHGRNRRGRHAGSGSRRKHSKGGKEEDVESGSDGERKHSRRRRHEGAEDGWKGDVEKETSPKSLVMRELKKEGMRKLDAMAGRNTRIDRATSRSTVTTRAF